jgi:hypothetical protein
MYKFQEPGHQDNQILCGGTLHFWVAPIFLENLYTPALHHDC